MPGVNVPRSDGRAQNVPPAPLPVSITTASALTEFDPLGEKLRLCLEGAVASICADACDLGVTDEAIVARMSEAASAGFAFAWAFVSRWAVATMGHGDYGGAAAMVPSIRRFPPSLASALLCQEDPRQASAVVASNAIGSHPFVPGAIATGFAICEAVRVTREVVPLETASEYMGRS